MNFFVKVFTLTEVSSNYKIKHTTENIISTILYIINYKNFSFTSELQCSLFLWGLLEPT